MYFVYEFWLLFMCNNVISCKNYQAGGDNMKFQIEKQVLGVLNKIVSKNAPVYNFYK